MEENIKCKYYCMSKNDDSFLKGLLFLSGLVGGTYVLNEILKKNSTKVTYYKCPVCKTLVKWNTNPCPNCNSKLTWPKSGKTNG